MREDYKTNLVVEKKLNYEESLRVKSQEEISDRIRKKVATEIHES
jgi:hypothetical protein